MTATIDFMLKILEASELDREEIKKIIRRKIGQGKCIYNWK